MSEGDSCHYENPKCNNVQLRGDDMEDEDDEGYTALIKAALHGDDECVEALIEAGADVNHKTEQGATALIAASENALEKVTKTLGNISGSGLETKNPMSTDMNVILMKVLFQNRERCVRLLLDAGAKVSSEAGAAISSHKTSAFTDAWTTCCTQFEVLVQAMADVNTTVQGRENNRQTAEDSDVTQGMLPSVLCEAARSENDQVFDLLLKAGIPPGQPCGGALYEAVMKHDERKVHKLLEAGVRSTMAISWAAQSEDTECFDLLLKYGIPSGHACADALDSAVNKNNFTNVHKLLEAGVRSHKALSAAVKLKSTRCFDLLMQYGIPAGIVCSDALNHAVQLDDNGNVRKLLQAGVRSPCALFNAVCAGNPAYVDALIRVGYDVNMPCYRGLLYKALKSNNTDVLVLLLRAGMHINQKSVYGKSTIDQYIVGFGIPYHTRPFNKEAERLLLVAGEKLCSVIMYVYPGGIKQYNYRATAWDSDISLMNMCRQVLREYLVQHGPPVNLFVKIPQLGLPKRINSYLLYNEELNYKQFELQ